MTNNDKICQNELKFGDAVQDELVRDIASKWDKWDTQRAANLETIKEIEKHIYPSKFSKQKPDIKMTEIYETRETYKAHLWRSWFSSLDTCLMFRESQERTTETL